MVAGLQHRDLVALSLLEEGVSSRADSGLL
jgi:hypothetical protein